MLLILNASRRALSAMLERAVPSKVDARAWLLLVSRASWLVCLIGIAFFTVLSSNIHVRWTGVTVLPSGSLLVALMFRVELDSR